LNRIKHTVSLTLDIATERLNEISLEDIEIDQDSQDEIYQALIDIALNKSLEGNPADSGEPPMGIPCTGFWVDNTRELILFAWSQEKTKTIVIPSEDWFLRDDITLH
jgi:hypothetical protein